VRVYLLGDDFLNKPCFWGRSVSWLLELLFG
jgi:rhamnogalacturonyl hydrolase YesR